MGGIVPVMCPPHCILGIIPYFRNNQWIPISVFILAFTPKTSLTAVVQGEVMMRRRLGENRNPSWWLGRTKEVF